MTDTFRIGKRAAISIALFVIFTIWWIILKLTVTPLDLHNQVFAALYGITAFWGGVWGVMISLKWGGWKSIMGKAILLFSIGLLLQEFGQLSYSFYIYFMHIEVPYPSIGDIGFFGSIPCYIYGIWLLGKTSGIKIGFKQSKIRIFALIIPLFILLSAYYLFLLHYEFDWTNPLAIFLDFCYPLGEAIYISLAISTYILSKNILGGLMKNKILFLLFALTVQFIADYTFLYQAKNGLWHAGGLNDYMYLLSYTLMALSLYQFNITNVKTENSKTE
jgi:hypothetical protein